MSNLNILFNQTITSVEENFNEEFCKLKAKINKENNSNNNQNKIVEDSLKLYFDIEKLKILPPIERLQKIMAILNSK